ncbi:MAG: glycyl-radical enzyme activating protein [Deltaproteobacteria bacterium]|nr:glycyl-radical enzyme activating protein [Deltaproteobacteria bacterium]
MGQTAADAEGTVFNVQRYSIHDGPGIRTTVFLKGCPLSCLWCQNPESQRARPELFFAREKCTGCGACVAVCPAGAVELREGAARTDRGRCTGSGSCVSVCPNEARSVMGRRATAGELFREAAADAVFYEGSGGGVTLSGGEPLAQPTFSKSLLELCREAGIHRAVETCGHAAWNVAREVLELADLVLYDLKHMDPAEHARCTGVPNALLLENARRVRHELGKPMLARVPVVPGYNDSAENVRATARFVAEELDRSVRVHLIPYHRLGSSKLERLESAQPQASIEPPSEEHLAGLRRVVESFGLEVAIGG